MVSISFTRRFAMPNLQGPNCLQSLSALDPLLSGDSKITVNSEIFARILFSRIALKDVFATKAT